VVIGCTVFGVGLGIARVCRLFWAGVGIGILSGCTVALAGGSKLLLGRGVCAVSFPAHHTASPWGAMPRSGANSSTLFAAGAAAGGIDGGRPRGVQCDEGEEEENESSK
jgi:hypothetical protein